MGSERSLHAFNPNDMKKTKILVPTDFTSVSHNALDHATVVAKTLDAELYLLHIVGDKKGVKDGRLKLNTFAKDIEDKFDNPVTPIIRIGKIFEDIDKVATELDCNLIIMGTHGKTGMQFLTGSRALRIVTNSSVPFIVVQDKGIEAEGYTDIVVPLDLNKETKQKLKLLSAMAKYFDSKIHFITPQESDEFLNNQLQRNTNYAKQYLEERGIDYDLKTADKGNFAKAVIKHSAAINADLIAIMNFYENSLIGILGGSYEEHIITNDAQVPVLCVNPIETFVLNSTVFN